MILAQEFMDKKMKMETTIAVCVERAMKEFREETGLSATNIYINLEQLYALGSTLPFSILKDVEVEVKL